MPAISATSAQARLWLQENGVFLGANQMTYSVPTGSSTWPAYAAGEEPNRAGYSTPTAQLATAFQNVITAWDDVIAPNFTEVADNASSRGELRIAFTTLNENSFGYAYQSTPVAPGNRAGDVWIGSGETGNSFAVGTYGYLAVIHEVGHTLGLKHSFEAPAAPAQFDSYRYTVMSYTSAGDYVSFAPENGGLRSSITAAVATGPMVLDVLAAQAVYGVDTTTRIGNSTYSFTQGVPTFQTIWDAGGNDTFDASSFTRRVIIDLRPGSYSSLGIQTAADQINYWAGLYPQFRSFIAQTINGTPSLYTYTDNVGIAFGATIENALGGSAADSLTGNEANNILNGGAGADTMDGLTGNDTYLVDNVGDLVVDAAGGSALSTDIVYTVANYVLPVAAEIEQFAYAQGSSTIGIALTGNPYGQAIAGTYGNDTIDGGGATINGGDILIGLLGDDLYYVDALSTLVIENPGEGTDAVVVRASASGWILNAAAGYVEVLSAAPGTASIDITGNALSQIINGNDGANTLSTGGGAPDTLNGGLGNDIYRLYGGADVIGDTGGNDTIYTSGTYRLNAGSAIELISSAVQAGTEAINLTGNEAAQTIIGNFGVNVLDGRGGNDTLIGLDGADVYAFTSALGAGNVDTIQGFVVGTDKIGLASDIFAGVTSGGITAGEFVTGTAAPTADSRLIYDQTTGRLFYDADANGGGAAVQFGQLAAGTNLTASDLLVIASVANLPA